MKLENTVMPESAEPRHSSRKARVGLPKIGLGLLLACLQDFC